MTVLLANKLQYIRHRCFFLITQPSDASHSVTVDCHLDTRLDLWGDDADKELLVVPNPAIPRRAVMIIQESSSWRRRSAITGGPIRIVRKQSELRFIAGPIPKASMVDILRFNSRQRRVSLRYDFFNIRALKIQGLFCVASADSRISFCWTNPWPYPPIWACGLSWSACYPGGRF